MDVVFSDLDGTLLDDRYSFDAAEPALEVLRRRGVPLVLATSKTRAEVELWRERLGNRDPFIVENGGAAFVPAGYFAAGMRGAVTRGEYEVVEFGDPYPELVQALREAAEGAGVAVRGFHDITDAELSALCGLPLEQAALARRREYDEPFEILDANGEERLVHAIEGRRKRHTRGGRFHHITGANDKAAAAAALDRAYRAAHGPIRTIGLGDGWNDLSLLSAVDVPVVMASPEAAALARALPGAVVRAGSGPAGWSAALMKVIGG